MTIALEHVQDADWPAVNRNIDTLTRLVPDTGGQSIGIRLLAGSVTWPGGVGLTTLSVAHGLGKTPKAAVASINLNGVATPTDVQARLGATNITLVFFNTATVAVGTVETWSLWVGG